MSQPRKNDRARKTPSRAPEVRPIPSPGPRATPRLPARSRRRGVSWLVVGAVTVMCLLLVGVLIGGLVFLAGKKPSPVGNAPPALVAEEGAAGPNLAREEPGAGRREGAVVEFPKRRADPPAVEAAGTPGPPPRTTRETGPAEGTPRETPKEVGKAEGPPPVSRWQPSSLTADEIKGQLRAVPELDFYPTAERVRKDAFRDGEGKLRRPEPNGPQGNAQRAALSALALTEFVSAVNAPVLEEAAREGLAVTTAPACKVDRPTACVMQELSTAMRGNGFVAIPGTKMDAATLARFERWWQDHPIEDRPGTRRILMQMLQVEDEPQRRVLVKELSRGDDPSSAAALARLAVFDPSPEVRRAAVEALKKCPEGVWRAVLLNALRYPWPPAADHAAEALVGLRDSKAVPALVGLLDQPDPARPILDEQTRKPLMCELVRVNHMRNCYLCHPAAPVIHVPVGGVVPRPGEPLPALYYLAQSTENVRADVTFLRQDFSVCQPVRDHGPWPAVQRYDYLLRTREATPQEAALLRQAPPATYSQREAILFALRGLTGADHGVAAKDWLAALDGGKPEPLPPWPDRKAETHLPRGKSLLSALAALGVGPLAKPHLTDESPDGKRLATVAGGNQVVIATHGAPRSAIPIPPLNSPITSVWWTLDGKTICASDAQGYETVYDAATGKQRDAFARTFRP